MSAFFSAEKRESFEAVCFTALTRLSQSVCLSVSLMGSSICSFELAGLNHPPRSY